MITREEFIAKVNSFNLGEEQTNKCIEYYDNPSKSPSKEKVIDEASAEDLVKTVNKWYGIKHSTKEKKPRTSNANKVIEKQQAEVDKLFDKIKELIKDVDSTSLLSKIREHASNVSLSAKSKEDEINNAKLEKYHKALELLNEYNKATGSKLKIVSE